MASGEIQAGRCAGCGGPHDFDTSIPTTVWNRVIRAQNLPEYLCTTCIVREFVKADEGVTAQLWGDGFNGVSIEVVVNGKNANDATEVSEENQRLRVQIEKLREDVDAGLAISGSFFEALKPLNLTHINVANPGVHVTEVLRQLTQAQERFQWIKDHVCGEAIPNWRDSTATTVSRTKIADVCDAALASLPSRVRQD